MLAVVPWVNEVYAVRTSPNSAAISRCFELRVIMINKMRPGRSRHPI
jgi:hypothetical protein